MPVSKTTVRVALAILLVAYLMGHLLPHAHAQSSLGIGTNEATLPLVGSGADSSEPPARVDEK